MFYSIFHPNIPICRSETTHLHQMPLAGEQSTSRWSAYISVDAWWLLLTTCLNFDSDFTQQVIDYACAHMWNTTLSLHRPLTWRWSSQKTRARRNQSKQPRQRWLQDGPHGIGGFSTMMRQERVLQCEPYRNQDIQNGSGGFSTYSNLSFKIHRTCLLTCILSPMK